MRAQGSCQIWTLSEDRNEYERFNRLLAGKGQHCFSLEMLNSVMLEHSYTRLSGQSCITLVHDPSDIRKPHSSELEGLGQVRDLQGQLINGYKTFNSVAIDGESKQLHLLGCQVKSEQETRDFRQLQQDQIRQCSELLHQASPQATLIHVLDREYDDQQIFSFLDQDLQDRFVIRLKVNRVSGQERVWDELKGKERKLKLKEKRLSHGFTQQMEHFSWGRRVYTNIAAHFSYDQVVIADRRYGLVKVELTRAHKVPLFKEPMLLLTNLPLNSPETALLAFRAYLRRSKIEGVFKFLKEHMGWESFQLRDFQAIEHMIVLCFFIGGYFYEIEDQLIENPWMRQVCRVGGGKGKCTKVFFLRGLAKIANHLQVRRFMEENDLSEHELRTIFEQGETFT